MTKFHSVVSRRDFMKCLGLIGSGVGAAAVTTPIFHDLDDILSSTKEAEVNLSRAWYVKKRDFKDIGIEIDWSQMKRRDMRNFSNWDEPIFIEKIGGSNAWISHLNNVAALNKDMHYQVWPDDPEPTTRDYALRSALKSVNHYTYYTLNCAQGGVKVRPAATPEELGMPKWQGTPEENSLMIRAAFSLVGLGPSIGVTELDEQTKNFVWGKTPPGWLGEAPYEIIFDETINKHIRTENPKTLRMPSTLKYVISTHNMSSDELFRRAYPICGSGNTEHISYNRVAYAKNFIEEFIRGLGYDCVYDHSMQPAAVWDMLSGGGEHCRMGQISLSPEYGGLRRTHAIFFTDLPLAPTNPIDAGIIKFCETCGICADGCPTGSIPKVDVKRNWENYCGQDWADDIENGGSQTMYNLPGYEGWRLNLLSCAYTPCASACKAICPFNAIPDGSFVHSIVKGTVATTSLFNGFFSNMEDFMHYSVQDKNQASWWEEPRAWHIYGSHPNLIKQ